ncbi:hypothetical protein QUB70_32765 [Microcoleus sp. A003_D6]|uniref:hypothetical protein n=1 Tax=Microcoleus sp. A003_D6 TaxID=3055266 RepID=UPI002FD3A0AD
MYHVKCDRPFLPTIKETGFLLRDCRLKLDIDRNPVSEAKCDRPFYALYPKPNLNACHTS